MTVDELITGILEREGSAYTNDTIDRGGPTKFGITLKTLAAYHHDDSVSADEVQALTEGEARAIYADMYVERPGFNTIANDALRAMLVDWGVTSGPRTPIKALQTELGVIADGILGSLTAYKANAADQQSLYNEMLSDRAAFCNAIVAHDPTQARFIKGWLARVDSFRGAEVV